MAELKYFIHEVDKVPVGPMTAQAALQFIRASKNLLGNLPIKDHDGKSVSLEALLIVAKDDETNAQGSQNH